jgi:hypothetical protein
VPGEGSASGRAICRTGPLGLGKRAAEPDAGSLGGASAGQGADRVTRLPVSMTAGPRPANPGSDCASKFGGAVRDVRTNAGFVLPVLTGERARDVFDHPYAYAARRGVPTTARAA